MQITPEWVAVVLTAMTMSGGAGAWFGQRRERAKAALPLIRPNYHGNGHLRSVEIVNRLSEDLAVSQLTFARQVYLGGYALDEGGSLIRGSQVFHSSPVAPGWDINAGATRTFPVTVVQSSNGNTQPLTLTISSSLRTLRSRRFTVETSQKL
jgi:hypothetical protein